ncbi:MAG: HAD family hydrolase [Lachnospiraceae bacterium]|nr:HAD family hydrolase [Lachnospiraceae bacterium]
MKQYVIFDVDGTLNQTELYAIEAYQKALSKRKIEAKPEDIIPCIGLSPSAIVNHFFGTLNEKEMKTWKNDIQTFEYELMKKKGRPFYGIENLLKKLRQSGYGLAICSNAFMDHIEHVLDAIGLTEYFDCIGSLELGKDKTIILKNLLHNLKAEKACMVGDRRFDLIAAHENNIPMIGCRYGYAPEEIADADIVVENPESIFTAVKKLL